MRVAYCRPSEELWPVCDGPPQGWTVSRFSDCASLEQCLRDEPVDAVVATLPPDSSRLMEMLSRVRVACPGLPVVVVAAPEREAIAVAAVTAGAVDYWLEGMGGGRLRVSVEQAAARRRGAAAQLVRDEALERVDDAVVITDAGERIVYWNAAATRLYGYPYAEVVGRLLPETFSPLWLDAETRVRAWRMVALRGVWLGEAMHARQDGSPVNVSLELSEARDGRGRRAGLLLVARPIRETAFAPRGAQEGERDLRDTRRFLESVLDSVSDPIFVKDREHRFLLVNKAFCELLGRRRDGVLGRTDADFLSKEQSEVFHHQDEIVFQSGTEQVSEEHLADPRGNTRLLVTKKTLMRDPEGKPILVGIARDITDLVKTVDELKRSQEQLRHAQKLEAVGRLSSGIAHDFNNILTAIVGCANILLEDLPPGHACREDALEIRRAGERATELTRQLLAFSRRGSGVAPRVVDLRQVCGDMRKMLQRLLPADIELDMLLPTSLSTVLVDRGQAEQVVLNLVVNAGDAMCKGGRVSVTLSDELQGAPGLPGACVRLSVVDTGEGMDEPTRSKIFEPFFTTKSEGTGIGLSTVWDIVSRSGGTVVVESVPGHGSSFHVYWPCCERGVEPADQVPPQTSSRARRRARVLVVEDDSTVRRFAERSLERAGYEVLSAADGSEALRLSDSHDGHFDVVVMDVVLPGLRGTEVAARMCARQPGARVLYISGYPAEDSLPPESGVPASFLQKPFTGEGLAERVRSLLSV